MKTIVTFLAMAALALAAPVDTDTTPGTKQAPAAKSAVKPAAKKSAKKAASPATQPAVPVVQPLTIPKDAIPGANGVYSYTDKNGKKWLYSKTPFGVSRVEDMGSAPVAASTPPKVFDQGDTVRFEQPSPFGTMRWEKKKSELTEDERQLLQAQQPEAQK